MTYLERLQNAQAQLDGIEHDPAAAMARAMYAAQQIGYCHIYDPAERTDYIWNDNGQSWSIQRGDRATENRFIDTIRAQVSHYIANA